MNEHVATPAADPFAPPRAQVAPFEFSGSGHEYFGIWIVNLLLSIVTLGIYSAWAKVRRLKYFYRSTAVAGASFDYHGEPLAILKGRIIGLVLLVLYNVSFQINPIVGLVCFVLLAAVLPWLLLRSLRFKLYNSSYRALRFRFRGSTVDAYVVFLVLPIATLLTLYLLAPLWHYQIKRYQHNNSHYGQTAFGFDAPVKSFYKIYLVALGIVLACIAVAALAFGGAWSGLRKLDTQDPQTRALLGLIPLAIFGFLLLVMLFISPYIAARVQNLVWNNTKLGPHRFASAVSARRLFFITVTNFLAIVATLGLYLPFAAIRLLKYRIECLSLLPAGDLEHFIAGQEQAVSATGEETAEMFDIDIGL